MLLEHIPEFLREIIEFKKLFSAFDNEIEILSEKGVDVFENQFILSCRKEGLSRFEKILGIESGDETDFEARRRKLILKFNEKLPYTVFRFNESLNFICGEGNYFFVIEHNEYTIVLRILLDNLEILSEVSALVDRMSPANLKVFIVLFNTHRIVGKLSHRDLAKFSHLEIYRENIFE